MLQKMRENVTGWGARIIIGLLIVTMAAFGFGRFDWFTQQDPVVATINGKDIHQSKLNVEVERQRQRIAAQLGPNADPNVIDTELLRKSVLDGLINRTLLLGAADKLGIVVSTAQMDQAIVSNSEFQNDGKFDPETFRRLLASGGLTPTSYRAELANSFTLVQLNGGIAHTPFVTDDEVRGLARLMSETRDFAYLMFDPEALSGGIDVADADVKSYYDEHPDEFMSPENVDFAYVEVSVAELAKTVDTDVSEAKIEARYEADKAAFKGGEQRRPEHILLQITPQRDEKAARAQLLDVKRRVAAGESFEAIAKTMSEDAGSAPSGGDLGWVSKGALVPEFERATWALEPGQISDPVTTQFGVHLIKLVDVRTDAYPPLEQKRASIVESLRRAAAEETYPSKVHQLDELAFESPDSLDTIASTMGLAIHEVSGVTRETGPAPFTNPKVRAAAFTDDVLAKSYNSKAIDLGDRAIVVHMRAHHDAERLAFETVAPAVRKKLVHDRAVGVAHDKAAESLDKVLAGTNTTTIAADAGSEWKVLERAQRVGGGVDAKIAHAAFDLPRPTDTARSATSVDLDKDRIAVVMLTAVHEGDYAALSEEDRAALRQQWLATVGNIEFGAFYQSLRDEASIRQHVVPAEPAQR